MFTGIIERTGQVRSLDGPRLVIDTGLNDLTLGESIAVNGVCLTVAAVENGGVFFFLSPETLAKSNLGSLRTDSLVNLERALRADGRLGGHIVQGHVDGIATLVNFTQATDSESVVATFEIDGPLSRYCAEKGSIALNGVSLTLNSIKSLGDGKDEISITLVPHTLNNTSLSTLTPGQTLNVEVDILSKYVEKLCLPYLKL